jgi:L-ascorbate metabolism protein UlaG (beta-lactamase superfamily)
VYAADVDPRDLGFSRDALGGGPITVRWLGTAGFAIEHDGTTLLIDPYVSRPSLWKCVTGPIASDPALVARHAPKADAIVLGHTHFDHALDAPAIARATGAKVFGSRSAVGLCRASGLGEAQVVDVEERCARGPWEADLGSLHLRFFPSAHSKLMLGRIPFDGQISDCDQIPLAMHHYKCGAVFGLEIRAAGRTIFHLGSAELVEERLAGGPREVDLLLMCVAGWTTSRELPERVARAFSPRAALLSHWDDFFRPIDRPARMLPAMKMPTLVDRLAREARDVRVGTLPIFGEVTL